MKVNTTQAHSAQITNFTCTAVQGSERVKVVRTRREIPAQCLESLAALPTTTPVDSDFFPRQLGEGVSTNDDGVTFRGINVPDAQDILHRVRASSMEGRREQDQRVASHSISSNVGGFWVFISW